jgi:hypothetical protein
VEVHEGLDEDVELRAARQRAAVGKVYQLTAIDVFTRWAVVAIVLGPVNATRTMRFIDLPPPPLQLDPPARGRS